MHNGSDKLSRTLSHCIFTTSRSMYIRHCMRYCSKDHPCATKSPMTSTMPSKHDVHYAILEPDAPFQFNDRCPGVWTNSLGSRQTTHAHLVTRPTTPAATCLSTFRTNVLVRA
jgi:hypothetical protein